MTGFTKPRAIEAASLNAVQCGCQLAQHWEAAVENSAALDPMRASVLAQLRCWGSVAQG